MSVDTLLAMSRYRRPMGSRTETAFRTRFLMVLPDATLDPFHNIHVTVPGPDTGPQILFSSHTDTVHTEGGVQAVTLSDAGILHLRHVPPGSRPVTSWTYVKQPDGTRKATWDHTTALTRTPRGQCLGADCTAGVYLMREMILAGVPGHYVFHYGEERGGIGSSALARHAPEFLRLFDAAIAFDRKDTTDIITHQAGQRTASDAFARSLADLLTSAARYTPSSYGLYTDTAEYADVIPECTNVSVGMSACHSPYETLDVAHLMRLRAALLTFDPATLVIARDPAAHPYLEVADDTEDYHDYRWTFENTDTLTEDDIGALEDRYRDQYLDRVHADVQLALRRDRTRTNTEDR